MLPNNRMKLISITLLGISLLFIFAGHTESSEPVFDKNSFVAAGYNETLLHITTPGRYSIQTRSQQGTAVK